jgi:hypothetical protein
MKAMNQYRRSKTKMSILDDNVTFYNPRSSAYNYFSIGKNLPDVYTAS